MGGIYVDAQTGFFDKKRAENDISYYLSRGGQLRGGGFIIGFDLDDFQSLNISLGSRYGDLLISSLSASLRKIALIRDRIYRIGGDRFIIMLNDEGLQQVNFVVSTLLEMFQTPWVLGGSLHICTASMGVIRYPADADTVETIFKKLDETIRRAKSAGKNTVKYYERDGSPYEIDPEEIRAEMEKSVKNDFQGFELHYQPIYDLGKTRVVRAEALLRWNMPGRGLILPPIFIPIAESGGMIDAIGRWVLREAAAQFREWRRKGGMDIAVSVNLSARQLELKTLVGYIDELFESAGFDPKHLTLELSERDFMKNTERNSGRLVELRDIGVNIAMDSFGTGYSTVRQLRELPFNHINIDRSIIKDAEAHSSHRGLVRAMVDSAHDMGISVCAEGIENRTQMEIASLFDIDNIQGYYLGRPMPAPDFAHWVGRVKPDRLFRL